MKVGIPIWDHLNVVTDAAVAAMERGEYMRKIVVALLVLFVTIFVFTTPQADVQQKEAVKKEAVKKETAPGHQYVGVSKCAMCHKSKARGNQVGVWKETAHANAYAALAGEAAVAAGKKLGIDEPQKSPKCLKCHVTAYGVDEKLLGSKYSMEDGVGCESCHGPGGDYMKLSIMKDREKAVEAGLVVPTEELCVSCHNKESPTFVKFDFKEMWPKIAHPKPAPIE
jgi:hypothetical protein